MAEPNVDIVIDRSDPERLAEFWAEVLGYEKAGFFDPYFVLLPRERAHPPVMLQRAPEAMTAKARTHFDLRVTGRRPVNTASRAHRVAPADLWRWSAPKTRARAGGPRTGPRRPSRRSRGPRDPRTRWANVRESGNSAAGGSAVRVASRNPA